MDSHHSDSSDRHIKHRAGLDVRPADNRPSKGPMDLSHALRGSNRMILADEHMQNMRLIDEYGSNETTTEPKRLVYPSGYTTISPEQAARIILNQENNQ